jgi:hypothetical protein
VKNLSGFRVLKNHSEGVTLFSEISDNSYRATNTLSNSVLSSELGKANPLSKLFPRIGHNKWHVVLRAEGLDKSCVLVVVAIFGKNAQTRCSFVEGFGAPKFNGGIEISSA